MAKLMSDRLKERLAEEMGVAHIVRSQGWGYVPSRECGRLVQLAIRHAEAQLATGVGPLPPPLPR